MKKIILDLRQICDRDALYDAITSTFDFPDYFGRNLDALYDCLTDISQDTCVALVLPEICAPSPEQADDGLLELRALDGYAFDPAFSDYIGKLRRTFEDAEEANPHVVVLVAG